MLAPKLGLLIPTLLAAGCAWNGPVRSLAIAANNAAMVDRDADGTVMMRSQQRHVVSVLARSDGFSHDSYTLPSIYVIVTNGGEKNVMLKPGDIAVYSGDRRVTVLDPTALQERLDREQAAAGSNASFPIGMTDASQPADGRRSLADPKVERFAAPSFKVPARFVEQALQPQVIRPFDAGGGRIMLEAEDILSGLPLKIVVTVGGEPHEFLFDVRY